MGDLGGLRGTTGELGGPWGDSGDHGGPGGSWGTLRDIGGPREASGKENHSLFDYQFCD